MVQRIVRPAVVMLAWMTLLTGVVYPLAVTGLAQVFFHRQATGSLIYEADRAVASTLIGQPFDDPKYFWSRPSATAPFAYNAGASAASNLGPSDPALVAAVQARIDALHAADPAQTGPVPVDLVTASASGLDPHISPAAAAYQAARVAKTRGLEKQAVHDLIANHTEPRTFGLLGEPRVHVVELNRALNQLAAP